MDRYLFETLVRNALRDLPRKFRDKIDNLTVEVEDRPSRQLLADMGITRGTLFGLYQGVPLTEREWNYGNMLPDRIVIYQEPIEQAAQSEEEIAGIVRDTVLHEVGHYFGFNDRDLAAMEAERRQGGGRRRG